MINANVKSENWVCPSCGRKAYVRMDGGTGVHGDGCDAILKFYQSRYVIVGRYQRFFYPEKAQP